MNIKNKNLRIRLIDNRIGIIIKKIKNKYIINVQNEIKNLWIHEVVEKINTNYEFIQIKF